MKFKFILVLVLLEQISFATTWNCPDGYSSTINSNIINHVLSGDTILVPSGNFQWTNLVTLNNTNVTLQGSGTNSTFVTNGVTGNFPELSISGFHNIIAGINFIDILQQANNGNIQVSGAAHIFLTNIFNTAGPGACSVMGFGAVNGVASKCYFGPGTGSEYQNIGDTNTWSYNGPDYGSTNFFYLEDCTWGYPAASGGNGFGDGAVDTYNGARYVVRHCIVMGTYTGHHGCDSGFFRSTQCAIVMNNTFYWTNQTGNLDTAIQSRGGAMMICSNTLVLNNNNNVNCFIKLQTYRYFGTNSKCYMSLSDCPPWSDMTGSNHWDGNILNDGWPGLDQVGRTGPTTFTATNSVQSAAPLSIWNNTISGGISLYGPICADPNIQLNRDYNTNNPNINFLQYPHPLLVSAPPSPPIIFNISGQSIIDSTKTTSHTATN